MKISIITASYNQGRFIQRAIDSVRNQKNVMVEHIVLDNCSTDQTGEVLQAYQTQPGGWDLKVFVEPDNGQTSAINRGFRLATGDVVCWLNTDEYYHLQALATVVEYFNHHPEADVVFGDCVFVDQVGNKVQEKREFGFNRSMLLYYGCFLPSCATFIRRRVIDEGFLLDESYRVCMDFEWYTRLTFNGFCFAHLPQILASFTWHDENISTLQKQRRTEERFKVQCRYSGQIGPVWVKRILFRIACYFWIIRRNLWRIQRALSDQ